MSFAIERAQWGNQNLCKKYFELFTNGTVFNVFDKKRLGLSQQLVEFITHHGKAPWTHNAQELQKTKIGILNFLSSPHFLSQKFLLQEKYCIFLWGSCDPNYDVVAWADNAMKHIGKPDLEDLKVVRALYDMYQGTLNADKGRASLSCCNRCILELSKITINK
jgi:hypothetical protein